MFKTAPLFRFALLLGLFFIALCVFGQDPSTFKKVTSPTSNKVAGIELTPPQTINARQRAAVVVAVADGMVKWNVKSATGLVTSWELPDNKNLLLLLTGKPDIVTVMAYTATKTDKGEILATDVATTTISVGNVSATENGGGVFKSGKVMKLHATFVLSKAPSTLNKTLGSEDFLVQMGQIDVECHFMDADKIKKDFVEPIAMAGGIPCVILQNANGDVLGTSHLTEVADVTKAIAKVRGN